MSEGPSKRSRAAYMREYRKRRRESGQPIPNQPYDNSPERLAAMRSYNAKSRKKLRGGRKAISHIIRGYMGAAARIANQQKKAKETRAA